MVGMKIKEFLSCLVKDLPCILCVAVLIASVALTATGEEQSKSNLLEDEQTAAFGLAKRSKDNQHKFGWGKRGSRPRYGDNELFDAKRSGGAGGIVMGQPCTTGTPGCRFPKLRIPYQRNGWNGGYGKRALDDDEEENYAEREEEEDDDGPVLRDTPDRNGWGGNYGRDVTDSENELKALLSARKRVFAAMDRRHGNGWNGAYGKRSRNGWNSAYGKKKRSVSES